MDEGPGRPFRLGIFQGKAPWEAEEAGTTTGPTVEPFVYRDSDTMASELNEFYSYADVADTLGDRAAFDAAFPVRGWASASAEVQTDFVNGLLKSLSSPSSSAAQRYKQTAILLYIAQGVYEECETPEMQLERIVLNCGIIERCPDSLGILLERLWLSARSACASAEKMKPGTEVDVSHWNEVTVCINILYFLVTTQRDIPGFPEKLANVTVDGTMTVPLLFRILFDFNEQSQLEGYPLKKLLLLLWKCILVAWGGVDQLKLQMNCARYHAGMPPTRDGLYTKNSLTDLEDYELNVAGIYYGHLSPPPPPPQSSASNGSQEGNGQDDLSATLEATLPLPIREGLNTLRKNLYVPLAEVQFKDFLEEKEGRPPSKRDLTNVSTHLTEEQIADCKSRMKNVESTWSAMFPNLSKYVIILLKILLAAVPSQKKFTGTVNLMSELRVGKDTKKSYVESLQQAMDEARHKEVIAKSSSAIIFLLLKHTKISHVLMFEYLSQLLVDANCILLILKFLNQDIPAHLVVHNTLDELSFLSYCTNPISHVAGTNEAQTRDDNQGTVLCWRNAFTTANLLRILQKLTKGKSSRISVLTQYKTAGILKRILKVHHESLVFYSLKLIKSQIPYLGRKWRNSNMRTISSIVLQVRSHYRDTQLFMGSDDIVEEVDIMDEQLVAETIEIFNRVRFTEGFSGSGRMDLESSVASTSLAHLDLDVEFEENYESWYDTQVGSVLPDEDVEWDSIDHSEPLYELEPY